MKTDGDAPVDDHGQVMSPDGMVRCLFKLGEVGEDLRFWDSDVPYISVHLKKKPAAPTPDEPRMHTKKRPAAPTPDEPRVMRKPSAKAGMWNKNMYSERYHKAKKAALDTGKSEEQAKQAGRTAAKRANVAFLS